MACRNNKSFSDFWNKKSTFWVGKLFSIVMFIQQGLAQTLPFPWQDLPLVPFYQQILVSFFSILSLSCVGQLGSLVFALWRLHWFLDISFRSCCCCCLEQSILLIPLCSWQSSQLLFQICPESWSDSTGVKHQCLGRHQDSFSTPIIGSFSVCWCHTIQWISKILIGTNHRCI